MDAVHNMNEKELLKACMPLVAHPSYQFLVELLRRRQGTHIKSMCSLGDPVDIYRAQGHIKAYDKFLSLNAEIKALR